MAVTTTLGTESDVDVYADLTVWCTDLEYPADVVDGFCAACGAQDHEVF